MMKNRVGIANEVKKVSNHDMNLTVVFWEKNDIENL